MSPILPDHTGAGLKTLRGILAEAGFVMAIIGFSYLICIAVVAV